MHLEYCLSYMNSGELILTNGPQQQQVTNKKKKNSWKTHTVEV